MLLTPEDLQVASEIIDISTTAEVKKLNSQLQVDLMRHQLTTDDALETLSIILHSSRREQNKIAVAKLALELNGVLKENEKVEDRAPQITFVFQDSNVNLNGIFNPKR